MILSPNFSNKSMNFAGAEFAVYARCRKSVLILAALMICLSGCTAVRDPVVRAINESSVIDINRPVAVLPVYNLSGMPAPLSDIRQSLIESLKKRGLNTLEAEVLQRFMAKYRIRYTGGIDEEIAKAFRKETGVETVLITSLELYSEISPPKVALTSRLVSTGHSPSILWIKGIGLAGDDSPGILELALIENPQTLSKMAVQNITASLAEYLSDQRYGIGLPKKRKKFRPKVIYRSPILDPGIKHRVAVLPFLNLSERKYAGEIMALHFVGQLGEAANFDVIEPGAVRHTQLGTRIIMDDGLSLANAGAFFSRLDADLVLTGKVMDYQDYQGAAGKPKVDFSAMLIERKSREVVWSSKSYNEGDDGVYFFDRGKVNTAHTMASEMVHHVVEMIVE
jgi:TolB-like protein